MDPEIIKRLDALAEKVGVTGERLWAALVRNEVAEATAGLGLYALFAVALAATAVWLFRKAPKTDEIVYLPATFAALGCAGCVIGVAASIVALINPEAAALKTLLGR